jgi:repressor LexA
MTPRYTPKQGQYLAFIYYYTKIHGRPPAEADFQSYFRVSPPAVHQMILTLAEHGSIERGARPGWPGHSGARQARSIRLLLTREQLPDLE